MGTVLKQYGVTIYLNITFESMVGQTAWKNPTTSAFVVMKYLTNFASWIVTEWKTKQKSSWVNIDMFNKLCFYFISFLLHFTPLYEQYYFSTIFVTTSCLLLTKSVSDLSAWKQKGKNEKIKLRFRNGWEMSSFRKAFNQLSCLLTVQNNINIFLSQIRIITKPVVPKHAVNNKANKY